MLNIEDLKMAVEELEKAIQNFKESLNGHSEEELRAIEELDKIRIEDIPGLPRKDAFYYNCSNLHTMKDIYEVKRNDLVRYRNIGKKTVAALDEWFKLHGLIWK